MRIAIWLRTHTGWSGHPHLERNTSWCTVGAIITEIALPACKAWVRAEQAPKHAHVVPMT